MDKFSWFLVGAGVGGVIGVIIHAYITDRLWC